MFQLFAVTASPHISLSLLILLLSVPAVRCSCTSLVPLLIESWFPLIPTIPDSYDVSLKFIYIYITKCSLVTVRYIRLVIIINYFSYSTVKCSKVRLMTHWTFTIYFDPWLFICQWKMSIRIYPWLFTCQWKMYIRIYPWLVICQWKMLYTYIYPWLIICPTFHCYILIKLFFSLHILNPTLTHSSCSVCPMFLGNP